MTPQMVGFLVWMVLGVFFLVLELLIPTNFILLCFGVGMIAASFVALLHGPLWLQLIIASISTGLSLWYTHRFVSRRADSEGAFGSIGMIGKEGYVIQAIDPLEGGIVRINGEDWRAITRDGQSIPERERIRVIAIEGTKLVVERTGSVSIPHPSESS